MNSIVRKQRQRGISIIALILLLIVLGTLMIAGFRIVPLYSDYLTILQITKDMQADGSLVNTPKREIRNMLNKRFRTNNLYDLKPKDTVKIRKDSARGILLHIEYEVRSALIYNLEVVAKFDTEIGAGN